jgi:hypothetical protein
MFKAVYVMLIKIYSHNQKKIPARTLNGIVFKLYVNLRRIDGFVLLSLSVLLLSHQVSF